MTVDNSQFPPPLSNPTSNHTPLDTDYNALSSPLPPSHLSRQDKHNPVSYHISFTTNQSIPVRSSPPVHPVSCTPQHPRTTCDATHK